MAIIFPSHNPSTRRLNVVLMADSLSPNWAFGVIDGIHAVSLKISFTFPWIVSSVTLCIDCNQRLMVFVLPVASLQKYSTYPPTLFFALHLFNTSIVPMATRSVPVSDNYLLLTRPIYQSPGLEHVVLTIPVLAHVVSGIALRNIRASRRVQLYGAKTSGKTRLLSWWPKTNLQARLGYVLIPLLGMHALVNRVVPLIVDGGSSGIGLGYVAHAFARRPVFWNIYYLFFVSIGLWHIIGGWAAWMGSRVTTSRNEGTNKVSLGNSLGQSQQRARRHRKMWWVVNGIAAVGTSAWLAGALGIIGRAGGGSAWETKSWNEIYSRVPIIGKWL